MKLRRSSLSVPGNSVKMLTKSAESQADCIVIDLEDSVPVSVKEKTRNELPDILRQLNFGQKELAIRINSLTTGFAHMDLVQVIKADPDAIVIPKAESPEDVIYVDRLLTSLENNGAGTKMVTIQAIIETARGVQSVDEIAGSSRRLTALIFGIGDYLADTGARITAWTDEIAAMCIYARSRMLLAAAAAGIDAIDSVYPDFKDADGLRAESQKGAMMGFKGKWAIHPAQIEVINESFTPTMDEFRRAKRMVQAYEKAMEQGKGSIAIDDKMIDEAAIKIAQKQCAMAKHLGLWDQI
ncbi:MAG: CoA ester lyase [Dehalococcoidia bacterium]|nr:CoA ester lyase [Dehalococcoidia bacterium]